MEARVPSIGRRVSLWAPDSWTESERFGLRCPYVGGGLMNNIKWILNRPRDLLRLLFADFVEHLQKLEDLV